MTLTTALAAGATADPMAAALAHAAKERKLEQLRVLATEIEACMVDLDGVHREFIDTTEPELASASSVTWEGLAAEAYRLQLGLATDVIAFTKTDVVQSYASLSAALDIVNAEIAELAQ